MPTKEPTTTSGKKVRIVDIAKAAGVGASTVTAALNPRATGNSRVSPATADRIRRVAEKLGYRANLAARQLRGGASGMIGVLFNSLFGEVNHLRLSALEKQARKRGVRLLIAQFENDAGEVAAYLEDFESRGLEGILALNHEMPDDTRAIPAALSRHERVVYLDPPASDRSAAALNINYAGGIQKAVMHLLERGRGNIAMAIADDVFLPGKARLRGYRKAMKQAGLDEMLWIGSHQNDWRPDLADNIGDEAVETIVERLVISGKADAIIASNDLWAVRLVKALKRRGYKVPKDVAIIGFNNSAVCWACEPELTSIEVNSDVLAGGMIELMSGQSDKQGRDRIRQTLEPELVVRAST